MTASDHFIDSEIFFLHVNTTEAPSLCRRHKSVDCALASPLLNPTSRTL